jgi:hypothetical protein
MKRNSKSKEIVHLPKERHFSTFDMGLCAALTSLGYLLIEIEKQSGAKSLFVFEDSDQLQEVAHGYWRGELSVNALAFFNAIKTVKNQLYSG